MGSLFEVNNYYCYNSLFMSMLYSHHSGLTRSSSRTGGAGGGSESDLLDVLLVVAVVATDDSRLLVGDMEEGVHGFVVSDTLWVVAANDAVQFVRKADLFLLHHLIVSDDRE